MSKDDTLYNDLFSSLISDIKNYNGRDPLLPWLRGIRKMKESLPPQLLKDKLPRFLQKCSKTFLSDRRYSNDLRYLRVWLQLLDFVDDPKAVLRTMEANRIGMKKSLFYQAYALYYEKVKKFEAAEKMYRLGVKNLAEPIDELQNSYEQFIGRMERHKNKKMQRQGVIVNNRPFMAGKIPLNYDEIKGNNDNISKTKEQPKGTWLKESSADTQFKSINNQKEQAFSQSSEYQIPIKEVVTEDGEVSSDSSIEKGITGGFGCKSNSKEIEMESDGCRKFSGDDTVVVRFVDTALIGKSAAEDARHHGLVEPTINTKEAMNAINSMFREPLEPSLAGRRSRNQVKTDQSLNSRLEVFVDENLNYEVGSSHQNMAKHPSVEQSSISETAQPSQQQFQIYIDDEETSDATDELGQREVQDSSEGAYSSSGRMCNFVFPRPMDSPSEGSEDVDAIKPPPARFREDTVVYRFVGSTISDEPQVENVCHHGLVDPTINLKEAMDDINSMFGKPIEFARRSRSRKQHKAPAAKSIPGGFLILPDDSLDCQPGNSLPSSSAKRGSDLFEQTICTKEAMDEINNMFKMPLDF